MFGNKILMLTHFRYCSSLALLFMDKMVIRNRSFGTLLRGQKCQFNISMRHHSVYVCSLWRSSSGTKMSIQYFYATPFCILLTYSLWHSSSETKVSTFDYPNRPWTPFTETDDHDSQRQVCCQYINSCHDVSVLASGKLIPIKLEATSVQTRMCERNQFVANA